MNDNSFKFGKSMVMSALFFVTVFSLMGGGRGQSSVWDTVHIWAGALMLISSATHLIFNCKWIKSVFSRPARELSPHVRRLRSSNLWLFISGSVCTLAGAAWLLPLAPSAIQRWGALHRLSGMMMIVMMGVHLLLHWNWLVGTVQQMLKPEATETSKSLPEAQA